jgi:hypothetical protein
VQEQAREKCPRDGPFPDGTALSDIPGTPAKSITFTLAAGSHDLEVVYTFTDPVAGRGELREACDANTFLKEVRAANKAVAYTICA